MEKMARKDLPEAERIYSALQKEIRTLQSLNARLLKRICDARSSTRGSLSLNKESRHDQALITVGTTSSTAPRGASN
jgi:hypothetical protein